MGTKKIEANESPAVKEVMSSSAIDRRRALLKGVGKGAAVLGATVPLTTLASTSVFTYNGTGTATQIRCGISGMTSGVHSRDITTNQCYGFSPGYYHKREHFPSGTNPDALITAVFPSCTLKVPMLVVTCVSDDKGKGKGKGNSECTTTENGTKEPTLLEVMNITPRPPEFHWLAAWLNAQPNSPAVQYPYTGLEIQGFYAANDQQAYAFICKYMEQHPGTQYPS